MAVPFYHLGKYFFDNDAIHDKYRMLFKIIYNQKEVLNGRPAKHHDIGDKIQFEHKKGKSLFDRFMTKEVAEVSMKKFIYDNLN